jgi:hypothetical protein
MDMRKLALMLALLPASANAHDDIPEAADMTLKTCIASVHNQIPGSKFDAYVVNPETGTIGMHVEDAREKSLFDKCMNEVSTIGIRTLLMHRAEIIKRNGRDICNTEGLETLFPRLYEEYCK